MNIKQKISDFVLDVRDTIVDKYTIVKQAIEDASEKTKIKREKFSGYKIPSDFSQINMYEQKQFVLHNPMRNVCFRFMLYTGENYEELCQYFQEIGVDVWKENHLIKNTIYSSGVGNSFRYVPRHRLRICIASNPVLIVNDKKYSLAINRSKIIEYLVQSRENRAFCYENIENTYCYDPDSKKFIVFSQSHPKGILCDELPEYSEWYIGNEDGFSTFPYKHTVNYEKDTHIVHIEENLIDQVETIDKLIFEINKARELVKKPLIFKPSSEDYQRRKILRERVLHEVALSNFVYVLYCYLFETTKNAKTRDTLPDSFKQHLFIQLVGEYRNHFSHGRSEYVYHGEISYSFILTHYLGVAREPNNALDFQTIQYKMLYEFGIFLKELKEYVTKDFLVQDIIVIDKSGIAHCGIVELADRYKGFEGCKCEIREIKPNTNASRQKYYIYYSGKPEYIDVKLEKTVMLDDEICHAEDILLPRNCIKHKGKKVNIKRIAPNFDYIESGINYKAIRFNIIESSDNESQIVKDVTSTKHQSAPIEVAEERKKENAQNSEKKERYIGVIEEKSDGRICVGTYVLPVGMKRYIGNVAECWIESNTQRVRIIEGAVMKKNGVLRCGNVVLPPSAEEYIGRRVRLNHIVDKITPSKPQPLKYYAEEFEILES